MSEENSQGSSGSQTQSSGESSAENSSVQSAGSESYNKDFVQKLLKEKQNARAEAEKLKAELAQKQAQELEKAGKLNELVELERQRAKELEERNKSLASAMVQKAVVSAAKEVAQKEGAQYFEVIERLLDTTKIEVNPETLEVDHDGIRNQIIGIKSRMPGLFVSAPPKTNDFPPGNGNIPIKSLSELSKDDLKELLRKKL